MHTDARWMHRKKRNIIANKKNHLTHHHLHRAMHYKIKWKITVSVRQIKRHLRIGVKDLKQT